MTFDPVVQQFLSFREGGTFVIDFELLLTTLPSFWDYDSLVEATLSDGSVVRYNVMVRVDCDFCGNPGFGFDNDDDFDDFDDDGDLPEGGVVDRED